MFMFNVNMFSPAKVNNNSDYAKINQRKVEHWQLVATCGYKRALRMSYL